MMRTIDISAWTQVGEGGNGTTYVNPAEPDRILKIDKPSINTLEFVKHEYDVSKAVESLGLQVPKIYEMVQVDNRYATLSQRINGKKSLSRICADEPDRTEEMAKVLCEHGKKLFSTTCNTDFFPSRKEQLMRALKKVQFIGEKNRRILTDFAHTIEEVKTCSHGDFNTGNLILAEGQYYWIDLDRFGYGDPMFDIGHLYQICNTYASMKQVHEIFHMTEEQLHCFWDAFAKAYTGNDDHADFDCRAAQFACLDMVLRYEFQKCTLPEKLFFSILIRRLIKKHMK